MTEDRRILFHGELQLQAWGESSTAGAWVKFWVHPEDLESFKLLKARAGKQVGQRLACVLMELGDDEALVEQQPAPTTPAKEEPGSHLRRYHPPSVGPLGMLAVRWCKDAMFQQWVSEAASDAFMENCIEHDLSPEDIAKAFVLAECGITSVHGQAASRKYLDHPEFGEAFQERIRHPFMQWKESQ